MGFFHSQSIEIQVFIVVSLNRNDSLSQLRLPLKHTCILYCSKVPEPVVQYFSKAIFAKHTRVGRLTAFPAFHSVA